MNRSGGFTAFIPAAGFGTRLRPITNHMPKALLPVIGQPLVGLVAARVVEAGASAIGINARHLPDMIAAWAAELEYAKLITLFREHEVLGTGGAIWNARDFLRGDYFLLHNCDILSDIDLRRLIAHHEASGNLITLAVHDRPGLNNLRLNPDGLLVGVERSNSPLAPLNEGGGEAGEFATTTPPFTTPPLPPSLRGVAKPGGVSSSAYTGIAVYSRRFIDYLPVGPSDVVAGWLRAAAIGERIGALDFTGCFWEDLGTPAAYASVVWRMLRAEGERAFFNPAARGCNMAALMGMASVEAGARITGPVTFDHAIVLPGANIGGGEAVMEVIANSIAGPDYRIAIPPPDDAGNVSGGGSDRVYRRVRRDGGTVISMSTSSTDPDYERQIAYSRYFAARGIPVPRLIDADADARTAVFADLGDRSLYTFGKCAEARGLVEPVYLALMKTMAQLHAPFDAEAAPAFRMFDYEHLRWETYYFLNEFVRGLCGMEPADPKRLDAEFHALAVKVDGFGKRIVHRDCQSQNIMLAPDGSPYLIDYQGARLGPPAYDMASLLWDPYVPMPDDMRERLVSAYEAARKENEGAAFDMAEFRASLLPCRLQRHMQALGAYAFLSGKKGKTYFRKHIPAAVEMLRAEAALVADEMPELAGVVRGLK
ncbi:MAG: phosphotransferase [Nitrospirae bacterium]|nr:phosphotransferase [Nitrospirota bacterium]